VADGPLRARLAAMCLHMARWHHWAGDGALAGAFAEAHRAMARGRGTHPLLEAMLLESLEHQGEPDHGGQPRWVAGGLGDPVRRRGLRARFLGGVKKPRGRDLALLDALEVVDVVLEPLLAELPGADRPRQDRLEAITEAVARTFVDALAAALGEGRPQAMGSLPDALVGGLIDAGRLDEGLAIKLTQGLLFELMSFFQGVCTSCSVGCFLRPRAKVKDAFFADGHPGFD